MLPVVYHGSYAAIEEINLSLCHKGRDFGRGFYVTKIRSQAEQWAVRKGKWRNTRGEVTEFDLHEELARILRLKILKFESYNKEWLEFVILNRANNSDQQAHDYDIVEGPVADDEIATRVSDYISGGITQEQFLSELAFRTPSHQMCFCTPLSLSVLITQKQKTQNHLARVDNDIVNILMKGHGFNETEAMDFYYSSQTFAQLADEGAKLHNKPWQEIYAMLKREMEMKI
jgi:predicted RNA-binding protein YlxR (DUF448 family)